MRFSSLRSAAAVFFFLVGALHVVPAAAETTVPSEASYANALRTINPKLPAAKALAYARSVMADAWRTKLDPRFIMSIVTVESRWRANAVSRVGARGLGQLMPRTARTLGVNAWNAAENLRGTSAYLKTLVDHFAGRPNSISLAIAGYNAGPMAVERYHGIPPFTETKNYVVRVLRVWKELNGRVGRAFARRPAVAVAARAPDEKQWVTNAPAVAPAPTTDEPAVTPETRAAAAALAGAAAAAPAASSTLTVSSDPAK
jgi:hypothetical protein